MNLTTSKLLIAGALGFLVLLAGKANADYKGGQAQGGPNGLIYQHTDNVGAKSDDFSTRFYDVGGSRFLAFTAEVSTIDGTSPTCDCVIETSTDRVNWFTIGTFSTFTAVGDESISISKGYKTGNSEGWFHRYVRANCVLDAVDTPTFFMAFYVTGTA